MEKDGLFHLSLVPLTPVTLPSTLQEGPQLPSLEQGQLGGSFSSGTRNWREEGSLALLPRLWTWDLSVELDSGGGGGALGAIRDWPPRVCLGQHASPAMSLNFRLGGPLPLPSVAAFSMRLLGSVGEEQWSQAGAALAWGEGGVGLGLLCLRITSFSP